MLEIFNVHVRLVKTQMRSRNTLAAPYFGQLPGLGLYGTSPVSVGIVEGVTEAPLFPNERMK